MNETQPGKGKKILYFFTALVLSAILVRSFVFDSFTVIGNSMAPTIQEGDHLFVNKLAYWSNKPARGDIVVGDFRGLEGKKVVKRVVAVPDEWLWIEDGTLKVSNDKSELGTETGRISEARKKMGELGNGLYYKLDPHEYFLAGDNEIASVDSFELGPVDSYHIDGRVMGAFRLLEWNYLSF